MDPGYLPYRKRDGTASRDALNHPYFAGHGYACLRVDMRGSGESDGILLDEYTQIEHDDCLEVLAWLEKQSWCTGAVGMIGISWGGFNGLQLAALNPPQLKAVVSIAATVDRYADDIHYKGGCLLVENFGWAAQMLSYMSRPPDPALVGESWKQLWLERLAVQPHLAETWFEHPARDHYWRHGSVCENYGDVKAAVLTVGGLADGYMNAVPALLENLEAPVKGLLGPWVHLYPNFAVPGPAIGFLQESIRWFDRWLKDEPNDVEALPALRAYQRTFDRPSPVAKERSGGWLAIGTWPTPEVSAGSWYLNNEGLSERAGKGRWVEHRSAEDIGLYAGVYFAWHGPDQPGDQRDEDVRSLCFDGQVPAEGLEILGRPVLHLRLKVNRPQAHLAVRLNEVGEDGASLRVSYGVANLSQRDGSDSRPSAMPIDEPVDVEVLLDTTCHRFTPGNRIRVSISTSYWPLIWPDPEPVTLCVETGTSWIELPVFSASTPVPVEFDEAQTAPPLETREIRPLHHERRVTKEAGSGLSIVEIDYDNGCYENLEHGLITDSVHRECYSIHP
ncbi:MAG: CocE/NonD family hydrolase, partial [Pseudomonadota bacterium]